MRIVDAGPPKDTLVFQVDLWSARGQFPHNMPRVASRQKEIQYSSRTRAESNRFKELQRFKGEGYMPPFSFSPFLPFLALFSNEPKFPKLVGTALRLPDP